MTTLRLVPDKAQRPSAVISTANLLKANWAAAQRVGDVDSPAPAVVAGRILELIDMLPTANAKLVLKYMADVHEERK